MSIKILLIGDLHFRAKKLRDIENAWSSAINWAHRNGVDLIVQAGDAFDHPNVYGREAATGTIYSSFLAPFIEQEKRVPLFVIPGNHDIGAPKDKDALTPIDQYPWISVIRKPGLIEINKGLSICAVPWLNRIHLISRMLKKGSKLEDATAKVNSAIAQLMTPLAAETKRHQDAGQFVLLVGHLEVTGAQVSGQLQHGGSFEFSPANIASVGADAYALAHLHIRQHVPGFPNPNDGYLGCLCQLSFGEQGNSVGCRLLEINDRKITLDRWLDNKTSPRYFTVQSLEGLEFRAGTDYVKLRSLDKPDSMPEGIIFERIPQAVQNRKRTDDKLDCDLSLRQLLSAWKDVTGCDVDLDLMVSEAEKIQSQCQSLSEAIGSIERVERIKLKNLTCHGETDIDMKVSGICGLAGPNGSGKTTAIEAIMLALYGITPTKPSIQSMLPKGDSIDSAVELHFISSGKKYIARREFTKTKKTFTHKAYIFQEDDAKPLASSVDGAFTLASSLVGDSDLVLAGIFSSQGDSENLVKQKPAQRKDLFAKLLGTEKFYPLAKIAEKLVSSDGASIQSQRSRLETIKIDLSAESVDRMNLQMANEAIVSKQAEIEKAQIGLDSLREELVAMELAEKEKNRLTKEIAELKLKREKIVADGKALKQRRKDLENLKVGSAEVELASAKAARNKADEIAVQMAEAVQKTLDFERELNELKAARLSKAREISDRLQAANNRKDKIESDLAEAQRRAGLLKGFPDIEECQTCPLAKDSIQSRNSIAELQAQVTTINEKIAKGLEVQKRFDDETAEAIEAKRNAFTSFEIADLKQERAVYQKEAGKIAELEEVLAKIANAKNDIAKIDGMIEAARGNLIELDAEIVKTNAEFEKAAEGYSNEAHQKTMNAANLLNFQIKNINADIGKMNIGIGSIKSRLDQHIARRNEIKSLSEDIKQKEANIAVYDALAKAFGRDGIPQLIVDSAIPHLQEIMFDMMSEIDGKWTIRIATQKETGKGTMQERIEILVDDGEDERDILTYSGGELNLLSTVIRIAFSILQAERSGKGLKVLVLDEAMYFADSEYSDAFMRMLHKLPQFFNQIFIISHSDFVLSSIQNKIFFARAGKGKTMVQTEFSK